MLISDDSLRAMYPGGRADAAARRFARLWAAVFRLGLAPKRWVTLEVAGRRSGRVTRFPLGMARVGDQWYLVSMLGERCNWVQNVRAADGRATLLHRCATPCRLVEVPVGERAPIIKCYLARVPGARPHVPVDRHAPLADFESIAARYPVFRVVPVPALARRADRAARSGRRHHWWRWAIACSAALVVLVVLAAGIIIKLQPSPAPLALPAGAASAPTGPLDGSWAAAAGSMAGFRVRESAFGMSNDTVGRTSAVTGTVVISGDQVTGGAFRIGLTSMKVGGRAQPQFAKSLDTSRDPVATITLTKRVTLNAAFASGATLTERVTGRLAMHGLSRPVVVTVSGRRDGSALQVAGSIPVTFSRWDIRGPKSFGFIASLASSGIAEFLLILHRS
ncbi:MAG: nitroreductase/quinone reductase family protein [Streptosporangiaceae bacterium]